MSSSPPGSPTQLSPKATNITAQAQPAQPQQPHTEQAPDPRAKKFRNILNQENVEMEEIKALCWNGKNRFLFFCSLPRGLVIASYFHLALLALTKLGIPQEYRAEYWQLLLGYMPTVRERREKTLATKRNSYW